jgi:hypothetical protein
MRIVLSAHSEKSEVGHSNPQKSGFRRRSKAAIISPLITPMSTRKVS